MSSITITETGLSTTIEDIGEDYCAQGFYPLESIQFTPGMTGDDILIVRDKTDAGAVIFYYQGPDFKWQMPVKSVIKYFHRTYHQPYVKYDECTLSAGHLLMIEKR